MSTEWSPPWPNGRRWWNSSPWRAVHRLPLRPRSGTGLLPARKRLSSPRPGSGARGGGPALRERLPRHLGPGETPGFEPLELLGDGLLDDRGQVAVGHRGAHEGPQPLELVAKLDGGGELNLVASRGEGLDHRGPAPGRAGRAAAPGEHPSTPAASGPSRRSSAPAAATASGRSSGSRAATPSSLSGRSAEAPPSGHRPRERLGVRAESEGRRRRSGPSVGQLPHHRRSIRTGRKLRHEFLDLSLRTVGGSVQDVLLVLRGQVRGELRDGRQVQPSVGEHGQEEGMLSPGAGGGDAEVGLGLGEVEDLGAVREHRGRGFARVEPSTVDLADVRDEVGLVATGPSEQIRQAPEELVVGERRQRVSAFHEDNIGRRFATSQGRVWRAPCDGPSLEEDRRSGVDRGVSARRTRGLSRRSATAREGAPEICQGESEKEGVRTEAENMGGRLDRRQGDRTQQPAGMPWRETSPLNERVKFIADYLQDDEPFSVLSAQAQISRKTG